ncbi:uncharacterized protein si:ch73-344o19.1 isoform X1 [Neoarius graeffei]|uniref:uncharacterized protein si:ch73-344o19.1 isoform X1 n=1 Tax=Neoarius graeffei TaxID=443677 RepID=UPI00298C9043|nr:uncharacterized protein si:ch73-344o19.1 isoform X1 [Neoarius graeffei]
MDLFVCAVWSVALLTNTPSLKAESSAPVPVSNTVSQNEAADLFVTSEITDPKEPIWKALGHPSSAPRYISSASTDGARTRDLFSLGAYTTSLPTMTPSFTLNHVSTKINDTKEPNTGATIRTDVIRPPESMTSTDVKRGSLDITPALIPLRSTTITPGLSIPSSTNLSEEHQNSSQSTTSEMIPTVSLIPPSIPASTLKDLITGSASLGKKNQDGSSELDVGDEDKVPSPSPLDPLLAGLISIFIISTAVLSIVLFLKLRQHSGHPEFHRLQDLPMDDLLEDTPLSRYSY